MPAPGGRSGKSSKVSPRQASLRATACVLAMQEIMGQFAHVTTPFDISVSLAIKAGIASGPVRRFDYHPFRLASIRLSRSATTLGRSRMVILLASHSTNPRFCQSRRMRLIHSRRAPTSEARSV